MVPEGGAGYGISYQDVTPPLFTATFNALLPGKHHTFTAQAYNAETVRDGDLCFTPSGDGYSIESDPSAQMYTIPTIPATPEPVQVVEARGKQVTVRLVRMRI